MVRSTGNSLQLAIYSHSRPRHLVIAAQVLPCVPVYAKKLLSVDDAIPKESPKYYAIPKEPLKDLYYAAPKEPLKDLYDAAPQQVNKDLCDAVPKEPLKEQVNNHTKYRSKPRLKERKLYQIQSIYLLSPVGISTTPSLYTKSLHHIMSLHHTMYLLIPLLN